MSIGIEDAPVRDGKDRPRFETIVNPTPDQLLDISRDTPEAAADHDRQVEIAEQLAEERIADLADTARRIAQSSKSSDHFSE